MEKHPNYDPGVHFWRDKVIIPIALRVVGIPLVKLRGVHYEPYRPKHKTFLLIANHNETLDSAYEMVSLMRCIRYVSSDHVVRRGFMGHFFNYFGSLIIKYRDRPSEELVQNIKDTLRAGVSVGLHAEGGMAFHGESRYISPNTAKLVKEADCAVITYCSYGGYMRAPRWGKHHRKGPLYCGVVREYSREEIRRMSNGEIYEMICRDLYVNAYEKQREDRAEYPGEALAESCEIVLYQCPACRQIGKLRSAGDRLACQCGYTLEMRKDGFFHLPGASDTAETGVSDRDMRGSSDTAETGVSDRDMRGSSDTAETGASDTNISAQPLIYDNICDWVHWQKEAVREYVDGFRGTYDVPVFRDEGQIVKRVKGDRDALVSDNAVLELFYDRLVIRWEGASWEAPLADIRKMDYVKWQTLLVVTDRDYFDIGSTVPRSPTKYMDAWRYLTGRPNY